MQTVILDATTKTLKGVLAGAITTTQPDYVIAWADSTSTTFTEGSSNGAFNSTSDVTMVAAPAASTRRVIKSITVYNRDTASITFTLKFDDNGTQRFLTKQTLASGASWSSDDSTGGGGISGLTVGTTSVANGTSGNVLYNNAGTLGEYSSVPVSEGGTGATSASGARSSLLPSYTSNGGKVLAVNTGATDVEWITASSGGGGSNSVADGRLTIQSSAPVTTSDITSASTLYYTPYTGNSIALYDGTSTWTVRTFSQLGLDISNTTNYKPNTNYDIFAYWTGSAVALESAEWTANTGYTITAITTGASPVLTYTGATSVFAVGDVACVQGCTGATGQNGIWTVTAVTSTTVTLAFVNSSGTYTANSGTIRKLNNARTGHSISRVNGVLCKDGATTRRYLGTITTTEAGGATHDRETARFVWNYNNRVARLVFKAESTNSWTYSGTTWRPANGLASNRFLYTCGVSEDMIKADVAGCFTGPSSAYVLIACSYDHVSEASSTTTGKMYLAQLSNASSVGTLPGYGTFEKIIDIGCHFLTWVEQTNGSTCTIYSLAANVRQSAISGEIWA